jgi:hypothetical protein
VNDNYRLIDLIESANDRLPFCECGRPTEPVYRDGVIWLECSSLREPPTNRMARILRTISSGAHVHLPIVDLPQDEPLPSAA